MEIKAADVAKLRKMTGAGMMDCKNALVEAEGDFNRAQEIIREKGKLVAAKRADRETTEGAVVARINGNKAILVSLGCETDFVAANAEFKALAEAIADAAIAAFPADKEALTNVKMADGRTVGEAITEPLRSHHIYNSENERREAVERLMLEVDLDRDAYNRYPHEFSGGQRQRVCIARALAVQPELVVCDESVSALDVSVQAQVLNLLNDLKRKYGYTYLFITHDLSVVKFFSDRIMVMEKGRIVEEGPSDQLFAHPQHPYTQRLLAAIPRL